jgi:hypothetical protein
MKSHYPYAKVLDLRHSTQPFLSPGSAQVVESHWAEVRRLTFFSMRWFTFSVTEEMNVVRFEISLKLLIHLLANEWISEISVYCESYNLQTELFFFVCLVGFFQYWSFRLRASCCVPLEAFPH